MVMARFQFEYLHERFHTFLTKEEQTIYLDLTNISVAFKYLLTRWVVRYLYVMKFSGKLEDLPVYRTGIFGQPLGCSPYGISVSHTSGYVVALLFPDEHPVGVDIEMVNREAVDKIKSQLTSRELQIANFLNEAKEIAYTRLWTAKESLSKVLTTGLTIPMSMLEISKVEENANRMECEFSHFIQYKAISMHVGPFMLSIVHPAASSLSITLI